MSQIWDIYCKHCLWSIFGPCWCTKSCKTTFYAHLSQIWKLAQFTRFIQKVFATKILLSGKFSLFATLGIDGLYWHSIINYQLPPLHNVLYWPSAELYHLVTHRWANWILLYHRFLVTLCTLYFFFYFFSSCYNSTMTSPHNSNHDHGHVDKNQALRNVFTDGTFDL